MILVLAALFICAGMVSAYPTLQLDIKGGTYDTSTETIVASSNPFTLYALLSPDKYNSVSGTYYISAAVVPKVGPPGGNLGSFSFNGQMINVTGQMVYGVPPLETIVSLQGWDAGDLSKHGIFETYFAEFAFQFSNSNTTAPYDTITKAGAGPSGTGSMYYMPFTVDTSLLNPNYVIHFDLYNEELAKCGKNNPCGDIDISQFAPFSHDAESGKNTKVPEPSSLLLLVSGLFSLAFAGRNRFRG